MVKTIKANSFLFPIWTIASCVIHMLLYQAKISMHHPVWKRIMLAIAAIVFILFVHEMVHFVFMKMFYKGKVSIILGKRIMGLPMPGVATTGEAKKWQEVIMRIAPFVFLTLLPDFIFLFCTKIHLFFLVVTIGNCAGCYYDMVDVCKVIKRKDR